MGKRATETKDGSLKNYTAFLDIRGNAYLTVEAKSPEEALKAAWAAYHDGAEPQGLEWDVDDIKVEEEK